MKYLLQKKEKGRYSRTVKSKIRIFENPENHRMHFAGKNKPYKSQKAYFFIIQRISSAPKCMRLAHRFISFISRNKLLRFEQSYPELFS